MGRVVFAALLFSAATCWPAHAALVISAQPTANVTCVSNVCSATSGNAVLNATTLQSMLASSSVTVSSGSSAEDISVGMALSWVSANTLTLDSYRSIAIRKPVAITGNGGLVLRTNDSGTNGSLSFSGNGHVTFWSTSDALTINGVAYRLVSDLGTLSGDIDGDPSGNYALADSYDAKVNGTFTLPPISIAFAGTFEGLGNTISKLRIRDTLSANVGLFAQITSTGTARDLHIDAAVIGTYNPGPTDAAYIGAFVGLNKGTIAGVTVSGTVTGAKNECVGGLTGYNSDGTISSSSSSAAVHGTNDSAVGGLVGLNPGGTIADSFASGAVSGTGAAVVGGLVGGNYGSAIIQRSHSTGSVTGGGGPRSWSGGLAGGNSATIELSYATGSVANGTQVGGLVGMNFDGDGDGIVNSYATGAVSSALTKGESGGLVGSNEGIVGTSYSTGAVTATGAQPRVGGSVGFEKAASSSIASSYWDTTTSGTSAGVGLGSAKGLTGLATSQLQSGLPAGFSTTIWVESGSINGGLPYLLANVP